MWKRKLTAHPEKNYSSRKASELSTEKAWAYFLTEYINIDKYRYNKFKKFLK